MTRRALVTGVSGFVGGYLAEHLLAQGEELLGTAPDDRPQATNSPALDHIQCVSWDFAAGTLASASRRAVERFAPQVIYHLAALSIPADCGVIEPTPQAVTFNADKVLDVLVFLQLPDGTELYPQNTDYTPRRLDVFLQAANIIAHKPSPLRKACLLRTLAGVEATAARVFARSASSAAVTGTPRGWRNS